MRSTIVVTSALFLRNLTATILALDARASRIPPHEGYASTSPRTLKPLHHFVTLHQGVLQALLVMDSLQPLTNPRFPAELKRPAKQQTRKAHAESGESEIIVSRAHAFTCIPLNR